MTATLCIPGGLGILVTKLLPIFFHSGKLNLKQFFSKNNFPRLIYVTHGCSW